MEHTRKTRKRNVKIAGSSEDSGLTTYTEDQTTKKKRRVKQTVKQRNPGGKTAMGIGNARVYDPMDSLSQEGNASSKTQTETEIIMGSSGSQADGKSPDPTNTCPVCSSSLKHAYIEGHTGALLQCTRCPTAQFLCGSCLYPWTPGSATCTNKMCALVSTLVTCGVVSDPKSKVLGCPEFRACPKCHNLITHATGCKFVTCLSCHHRFCFICLQDNCSKDKEKYWSLTCKKQRADRQRLILT